MIVVAGPPGSGKSTAFPVSGFGVKFFNADDRAASLNGNSYLSIPMHVREQVNREYEVFVNSCILRRESFAIQTTLRSAVTFEQAAKAHDAGFAVEIRFLSLASFQLHLDRVKTRADAGGHSAPEEILLAIHRASLKNLLRAIDVADEIWIYDNSTFGGPPTLVAQAKQGTIAYLADNLPAWLVLSLGLD